MLLGLLLAVYVFVCIVLCLLVLIQSDKGGGISGAIGGGLGGVNTLLGTTDTANILTRLTTGFAIAFMVLCISIAFLLPHLASAKQRSLLKQRAVTAQNDFSPASVLQNQPMPVAPAGGNAGTAQDPLAPPAAPASPIVPPPPAPVE